MDPSRASFAEQVDHYAKLADLNNYKLSLAIGLLPGRIGFSAKQVERLRKGTQRPTTEGLVERLIEVFREEGVELTEEEADYFRYASGLIPDGWDFETFRQAAQASRRRRRGDRQIEQSAALDGAVLDGPPGQAGDCPEASWAA